MARKSTFVKEPRQAQYDLKQSLIRTGYGYLPDELRQKALTQIETQKANWQSGFGVLHRAWLAVVDRCLAPSTVPKLDYAKYKAFTNEYVVKVISKGTETSDMVKTKFTNLGADSGILDTITGVLGEVMG
jgi:hypothetical protein